MPDTAVVPPLDEPDPVITPLRDGEPSLVFSPAAAPAAGLHALVIGVSDYQFLPPWNQAGSDRALGMKKLQSPALSAYRVAQWLVKNSASLPKPLASLRLLVSPSETEMQTEPGLRALAVGRRPTFENVAAAASAWRRSADGSPDGMTLLFYSGHGLQLSRESTVLIFDDFGQPFGSSFLNTCDLSNIVGGMNPSREAIALPNTQLYFIDACRVDLPADIALRATPSEIFNEYPGPDTRSWPIYFATASGTEAFGEPGSASYFTNALLKALEIGVDSQVVPLAAGSTGYLITVPSLASCITELLRSEGLTQGCYLGGVHKPQTLVRMLKKPPMVEFLIAPEPPDLVGTTKIRLVDGRGRVVQEYGPPPPNHPYTARAPLGIYSLEACRPLDAVPARVSELFPIGPLLRRWPVNIQFID